MLEVLRDNLVELLGFLGGGELAVVGCVLGKTLVTWGGGKVGSHCPEQNTIFGFVYFFFKQPILHFFCVLGNDIK